MTDRDGTPAARTDRRDLSDLVRARRRALGLSLAKLEELAIDPKTGRRVKSSWVHDLEHGRTPPPELWRLRGLSVALELDMEELRTATAAQFYGVTSLWEPQQRVRIIVPDLERLDDEALEQVLRLARLLAPRPREGDESDEG
ncbi:Helix-turn-helix domain-containing protein [Streptomyces aidingensis]|uniref:Helix-turn-helix domain-containing protein n=2 Tax=Streptomyces aidingensis TaxID=910347 RepID=A0A1I1PS68_9ACTN|nr:Helix-turn-helix domain-containing protein [Streptomyces aidingensis]